MQMGLADSKTYYPSLHLTTTLAAHARGGGYYGLWNADIDLGRSDSGHKMGDEIGFIVAILAGYRTAASMIKSILSGIGHASTRDEFVEPAGPTEPERRTDFCHLVRVFSPVTYSIVSRP